MDEHQDRVPVGSAPQGLSSHELLKKDTAYSPASDTDTEQKQGDVLPTAVAEDDIDPEDIRVLPGTGGPDDVGDVDVDPRELNLPHQS